MKKWDTVNIYCNAQEECCYGNINHTYIKGVNNTVIFSRLTAAEFPAMTTAPKLLIDDWISTLETGMATLLRPIGTPT
ncbi:hypothetical protein ACTNES_08715 [Blautia sp. HCP3S3_D9]|uniref:hypothetical protein n=1 Tax=Blautia sp. HCP3S3_D9 TaxID=3438912 RepID=UPI003F88E95A